MATKNTAKSKSTAKPATTAKAKDLPAKKDAKGGSWFRPINHNETLISDTAR